MTKRGNVNGGSETRGPKLNENRRSLKVVSQVMKKATVPERKTEERERGRRAKREKVGKREMSLNFPLGSFEDMKYEYNRDTMIVRETFVKLLSSPSMTAIFAFAFAFIKFQCMIYIESKRILKMYFYTFVISL